MNNRIDLVAGQNCPLSSLGLHVLLSHGQSLPGLSIDVSAFLLSAQGKVASDNDFIFFNQPVRSDQGVELDIGQNRFTFHLERATPAIQKIAVGNDTSGWAVERAKF